MSERTGRAACRRRIALACTLLTAFAAVSDAQDAKTADPAVGLPESITPSEYLYLPRVGDYRRQPLHVDPVEAAIARGEWASPQPGDEVNAADGAVQIWASEAEPPATLAGGYAYAEFESPADGIFLLQAPGVAAAWLNGEWVVGDPYGTRWFQPPVAVSEGVNRLLLHLANPAARVTLVRPPAGVFLLDDQATVPDEVVGKGQTLHASLPLVNATGEPLSQLDVAVDDSEATSLPWIAARSITPLNLAIPASDAAEPAERTIRVTVRQRPSDETAEDAAPEIVASTELTLRVVRKDQRHTRTHISDVDGSVQPYAVLPASSESETSAPGVLLVLHDAGEDHQAALDRCESLPDTHLVAPGGRGPFGFDWEDWSATDALEALNDFLQRAEADASRVAVTGRGMGGHGALRLATLAPERFTAAAPIGGWVSFYTRGRAAALTSDASRADRALLRRSIASDPLRVLENLRSTRLYVAHAPDDAAVTVAESRLLRSRLAEFHPDFAYSESAGAGRVAPGSSIDDFCGLPMESTDRDRVRFATNGLGQLAELRWARIEGQVTQGEVSAVDLRRDSEQRRFVGSTENVARLSLKLDGFTEGEPIKAVLDGGSAIRFDWPRRSEVLRLAREDSGRWRRARFTPRGAAAKSPAQPGGLKSVFDNRPLLVYGTQGGQAERRWAEAKARYDAMLFYYRGSGRLDVLPDSAIDLRSTAERNIVLYGNASTNRAYRFLMQTSPVWVDDNAIEVGPRPETGDDLGAVVVRPRWNSKSASVAVVGGTGVRGMRLTTRLRYFWSGIAYPDLVVFGPAAVDAAPADTGVDPSFQGDLRAVGDFGADWSAESGDIAWRDVAF